jgi:hypothetical protein
MRLADDMHVVRTERTKKIRAVSVFTYCLLIFLRSKGSFVKTKGDRTILFTHTI